MNELIYDLIIAGSGPAGLTAAVYAARAELNMMIIEKAPMSGGQIINTYEVDNYPGLPGISGFELALKFREHCDKLGVNFNEGEIVKFTVCNNIKCITLENGEEYKAKAVIIATGAQSSKLSVKGEKELMGKGVSYCATCDGAFFKNKTVAVIGGGDVAVEDAIFLSRICKKVYVVHRRDEFRAVKSLSTKLLSCDNVKVLWNTVVMEIGGSDTVTGIHIKDVKDETEDSIEINGIFIAVGNKPNSEIFNEVVASDESKYIIADESCKTNIKGVFAAGDVRTKHLRQVITAAADGANAVLGVEQYLNEIV